MCSGETRLTTGKLLGTERATPLGDELGHRGRAIQSKGDSLLGLAQPQNSVQPSVQQVVEIVLVLSCRTVYEVNATKSKASVSRMSHDAHKGDAAYSDRPRTLATCLLMQPTNMLPLSLNLSEQVSRWRKQWDT